MRRLAEQRNSAEDHAGGAVAALEGALVKEGLLNRSKTPVLFEAFDCDNLGAADAADRQEAGARRYAVEQDGAGAALALAAAVVGSGEFEMVAKNREQ